MPTAPRKHKLTLLVGDDLTPYYSIFDKSEPQCLIKGESRIYSRTTTPENIDGFLLLISHTALQQEIARRNGAPFQNLRDGTTIPDISHHLRHMTEGAWTINRNPRPSKDLPWIHLFFGGINPNESYLHSETVGGTPVIWFDPCVDIDIKFEESRKPLDMADLRRIYYLLSASPRLDVTINVKHGHQPHRIINNFDSQGTVFRKNLLRVEIDTNFSANFLVFWVSSDCSVVQIHPNLHRSVKGHYSEETVNPNKSKTITIPREPRRLQITTAPGTETCIVLIKKDKFKSQDAIDAKKRIQNRLIDNPANLSESPWRFETYALDGQKRRLQNPDLGIGGEPQPDELELEIVDQLHGFADQLHFLHITNKRSPLDAI